MLRDLCGFDYWPSGAADANAVADGFFGDYDLLTGSALGSGRFAKGRSAITEGGPTSAETQYDAIGMRFTGVTTVVGQAFYVPASNNSLPSSGGFYFGFYDAEGGVGSQMKVYFTETGVIRLYRGSTLVATSAADSFHFNEWIWVEIKLTSHATTGLCEVRVNTVTKISYVGNTTSGTPVLGLPVGWDTVFYQTPGSTFSKVWRWDDRYILDDTGTNNTDYLGNVRVNIQLAIANGDVNDFSIGGTAPAATNWQSVIGTALDDTKFVYSPDIGDQDLYEMDPNVIAQNIFGIQVRGAYRQDDSTQMVAKNIIKTNGVVYEGSNDHYLSGSYRYYKDIWELNPDTGVGWVAADLNSNFQAGTKVEA